MQWDGTQHKCQCQVLGLYFSAVRTCGAAAERESSDAGSGIPQRARRAGCLSPKPASGAESTISPQSFHFQQLKVIIHSQGWRNARTSGAGPIFKHISQLNNLRDGVTMRARFIIDQALSLTTSTICTASVKGCSPGLSNVTHHCRTSFFFFFFCVISGKKMLQGPTTSSAVILNINIHAHKLFWTP